MHLGLYLAAGGGAALLLAAAVLVHLRHVDATWVRVQGEVVAEGFERRLEEPDAYHPVIRYETARGEVLHTTAVNWLAVHEEPPVVGRPVEVRHHPRDPQNATATLTAAGSAFTFLGGLGALFVVVGLVLELLVGPLPTAPTAPSAPPAP